MIKSSIHIFFIRSTFPTSDEQVILVLMIFYQLHAISHIRKETEMKETSRNVGDRIRGENIKNR